ncbi:kinase-like domain-containing protein [Chytriomyces cf. hyalinus JEL632]|nr:kinase-like domain-containing protein [Chytriomyces cf. hyalinus JEL632]
MNNMRRSSKQPSNSRQTETEQLAKILASNTVNIVGNYVLGRTLGEGSFGKVKLATHTLTGQEVAVKVVDKIHAAVVAREIETWRHLHHPNIAQLLEVLVTESKIYMITEYCEGGEAFDYLCSVGRMDDGEAATRKLFREIVMAVGYCHEKNFVHRDLKLENVLLTKDLTVKVIDFGFTRPFKEQHLLDTYCGSVAYAAPEMILGKKYSGPQADIWSLGVILYTLLCGSLPFDDDNESIVHQKISELDYELPDYLHEDSKSLISQILKINPTDRISVQDILLHPWFTHFREPPNANHIPNAVSPSFSTPEEALVCREMHSLGLDVEKILDSVCADACDSASALWYLLLTKNRERRTHEVRKDSGREDSGDDDASVIGIEPCSSATSREALFGSGDGSPLFPLRRGELTKSMLGDQSVSHKSTSVSVGESMTNLEKMATAARVKSVPPTFGASGPAVETLRLKPLNGGIAIKTSLAAAVGGDYPQTLQVETFLAEARRRRSLNPSDVPSLKSPSIQANAVAVENGAGGGLAAGNARRRTSVGILAAAIQNTTPVTSSPNFQEVVSGGSRRGLMINAMRANDVPSIQLLGGFEFSAGSPSNTASRTKIVGDAVGSSGATVGGKYGRRADQNAGNVLARSGTGSLAGSSVSSSASSSPKTSTPRQIAEESEDDGGADGKSSVSGLSPMESRSLGRRKAPGVGTAGSFSPAISVISEPAGLGSKIRNRSIVEEDE